MEQLYSDATYGLFIKISIITHPFMRSDPWLPSYQRFCSGRIMTLSAFTFRLLSLDTASLVFPQTACGIPFLIIGLIINKSLMLVNTLANKLGHSNLGFPVFTKEINAASWSFLGLVSTGWPKLECPISFAPYCSAMCLPYFYHLVFVYLWFHPISYKDHILRQGEPNQAKNKINAFPLQICFSTLQYLN